jgi:hypothetical protein
MSVVLPAIGVLLARDVRTSAAARVESTILAAAILAAAVGAFGAVVGAAALAVNPGTDAWASAASIAIGGVLVQIVANLVGTGMGLLIRPAGVAFLATIVVPLGFWFILGLVNAGGAQAWLTPYGVAQNLLTEPAAVVWVQWLLVFLLWGVGLNLIGARRPD